MKKLILTEDDFYRTLNGPAIRGGNKRLYEAELVIKVNRDGTHEVIKDRFGLSKSQIEMEIESIDERLILML